MTVQKPAECRHAYVPIARAGDQIAEGILASNSFLKHGWRQQTVLSRHKLTFHAVSADIATMVHMWFDQKNNVY